MQEKILADPTTRKNQRTYKDVLVVEILVFLIEYAHIAESMTDVL